MKRFRCPLNSSFFFLLFCFCLFSFFPTRFSYSFLNFRAFPSDEKFLVFDEENVIFIFPEKYKKWMPEVIEKHRKIKSFYEKDFHWEIDGKLHLLYASPRNHVTNALASFFPDYRVQFLNGGVDVVETLGGGINFSSWMDLLLVHEMSHIYQLSPKPSFAKPFFKVFRHLPLIIPFFPNAFTSRFMIEGNATYNESRMRFGGRLFSPINRALFLALVKENKVGASRLKTDHYLFPGLSEKYIVGAYFNEFLNSQYANPNLFFLKQSKIWYLSFFTNPGFRKAFNRSFRQLVLEFKGFYSDLAFGQKRVSTPVLARSFVHFGLNKDKDRVFFITSKDLRSENKINVYLKSEGSLKRKKINIPSGKLFLLDDKKFYSRASQKINWAEVNFGLFTEGTKSSGKYLGKYVFDRKKNRTLFAFSDESAFEVKLYLDNEERGLAYTSPLLDDFGNIYDFKQEGGKSFLIRNQEVLFSLKTYFPKLIDLSSNGDRVFFIGATLRGSSLFMIDFRKNKVGKVYRLSQSDSLVDAKQIQENQFFVAQVTGEGYSYHVINSSKPLIEELPYQVKYSSFRSGEKKIAQIFQEKSVLNKKNQALMKSKKQSLIRVMDKKSKSTKSSEKSLSHKKGIFQQSFEEKKPLFRNYNSLKTMDYKRGVFVPTYLGKDNYMGILNVFFSDPLLYHNIELTAQKTKEEDLDLTLFNISYANQKSRLIRRLGYVFYFDKIEDRVKDGVKMNEEKSIGPYIEGEFPFFYRRNWSMTGRIRGLFNLNSESEEVLSLNRRKERILSEDYLGYSLESWLSLNYGRSFSFSYHPYRYLGWIYHNKLFVDEKDRSGVINSLTQEFCFDMGFENFILSKLGFIHVRSDRMVSYRHLVNDRVFRLVLFGDSLGVYDFFNLDSTSHLDLTWGILYYKKVINLYWYNRSAVGIHRVVPYIMGYGYSRDERNSLKNFLFEKKKGSDIGYSVGLESELIIAGKFLTRLIVFTRGKSPFEKKVGLTFKVNF